ncbi:adenosylcobinamide amidohydrolase [Nocardiopsis baichengensis]|uniref:adenosylcobinamide amidohydrolase n=1 Tax=Nocardiopsis baichengensis TaxID=280240 RepID=UPI00034C8608|nr:adenosylcobinamide amidohydrolase [Nocardiopsis baichengensis]
MDRRERTTAVPGGALIAPRLHTRREDGRELRALVWDAGPGWRMLSSAVLGGGLGDRSFVVNAQVSGDYRRLDPAVHLRQIASRAGVRGRGVGLMTAAEVSRARFAADGGAEALATVGIGRPTWAADSPDLDEIRLGAPLAGPGPGTINIVVAVPEPLSDSGLANLLATVVEAKVQAVMEAGFACTGTASDAVAVACRTGVAGNAPDPFGGPRSRWGGRAARAVRDAVRAAAEEDAARRDG